MPKHLANQFSEFVKTSIEFYSNNKDNEHAVIDFIKQNRNMLYYFEYWHLAGIPIEIVNKAKEKITIYNEQDENPVSRKVFWQNGFNEEEADRIIKLYDESYFTPEFIAKNYQDMFMNLLLATQHLSDDDIKKHLNCFACTASLAYKYPTHAKAYELQQLNEKQQLNKLPIELENK